MAVLTVPEAKDFLNITGAEHDDEIADIIDAAEAAIAERVGPLEPTVYTTRVTGNGGLLLLDHTPVVSLTSITPDYGSALELTGIYTDPASGVVSYLGTGVFPSTAQTVVYTAGRTTCPPDLLLAVKYLVKSIWASQRGGSKKPGTGGGDSYSNTVAGAAQSLVFDVERYLSPHTQHGFA